MCGVGLNVMCRVGWLWTCRYAWLVVCRIEAMPATTKLLCIEIYFFLQRGFNIVQYLPTT